MAIHALGHWGRIIRSSKQTSSKFKSCLGYLRSSIKKRSNKYVYMYIIMKGIIDYIWHNFPPVSCILMLIVKAHTLITATWKKHLKTKCYWKLQAHVSVNYVTVKRRNLCLPPRVPSSCLKQLPAGFKNTDLCAPTDSHALHQELSWSPEPNKMLIPMWDVSSNTFSPSAPTT